MSRPVAARRQTDAPPAEDIPSRYCVILTKDETLSLMRMIIDSWEYYPHDGTFEKIYSQLSGILDRSIQEEDDERRADY